jgi:hypothetical protein
MDRESLESLLVRHAEEPAVRDELIAVLFQSKVAIPLDKGLEDGALPADFKPLCLNAEQGFPVVAIFTAPDKARPWLEQHPAFQHCLVTDFTWVARITPPPFGIALNPGYRYALALSPAEVASIKRRPA